MTVRDRHRPAAARLALCAGLGLLLASPHSASADASPLPTTAEPIPDATPVSESPPVSDTTPVADSTPLPAWIFPPRSLLPGLLAGPRDPVTQGQLVYLTRNPTAFGPGPSGEVAITGTVPLLLLSDPEAEDVVVIGMEGAAFAHFSFEVVTRELVNTDWIFAVPLVWRRGSDWARIRYYHTSSHLGDEYQRRFGPSSVNFSRDGVDITGYARPDFELAHRLGLAVYAGTFWSVNSHPEGGSVWRTRAGVELDPFAGHSFRPYAALDVEEESGGSAEGFRWTVQAGLWLPRAQDRPLRLALEYRAGPSAMGQFSHREVRRVALGLFWSP